MKKMMTMLLAAMLLCALAAQAFAIALPADSTYTAPAVQNEVGTAIVEGPKVIEVTECLGMEEEAFKALVKEKGLGFGKNRTKTDVRRYEDGSWANVLAGFMLYTDDFTVMGYEINGRLPDGYQEALEAEGFVRTRYQFEGGLEFITFEKTVGEAVYRFKINACDRVLTYLEWTVDDINAHFAAQQ